MSMTIGAAMGASPRSRLARLYRGRLIAALILLALAGNPLAAQQDHAIPLPHDPSHAERARHWCGIHLTRSELVEALSDCDHAIARDPKDAAALSNRGAVRLAAKEASKALQDFNAAIALARESGFYFNRGIAHGQLGAWEHAVADYTEAIRIQPDFAFAYHNRGIEHEQRGSHAEAKADFERALEIDPNLTSSRQALERIGPP